MPAEQELRSSSPRPPPQQQRVRQQLWCLLLPAAQHAWHRPGHDLTCSVPNPLAHHTVSLVISMNWYPPPPHPLGAAGPRPFSCGNQTLWLGPATAAKLGRHICDVQQGRAPLTVQRTIQVWPRAEASHCITHCGEFHSL